jgi:RimJ/RimL family protein N-acetyltransferase
MEPTPSSPRVEQLTHLMLYRHIITLADGMRVCLRPLTPKDRDALVALFGDLPPQETQYFRSDVADSQLVARWAEQPDYASIFPLVAVVGDRIVGNSTLHLGSGYTRHVAQIRIFLAKDFRRHGIGSAIIKAQLEIARKLGLHQVVAEIVESRPQVIHAFERLGFERQFVWKNLFMTPEGEKLDMVVLINSLRRETDEF